MEISILLLLWAIAVKAILGLHWPWERCGCCGKTWGGHKKQGVHMNHDREGGGDMTVDEWKKRYAAYMKEKAALPDDLARLAAETAFEEGYEECPDDPEGQAEMELSHWDDDGE